MFRFGMKKIEPRDFAQVQQARKVKLKDNKRYKVEKGSSCSRQSHGSMNSWRMQGINLVAYPGYCVTVIILCILVEGVS